MVQTRTSMKISGAAAKTTSSKFSRKLTCLTAAAAVLKTNSPIPILISIYSNGGQVAAFSTGTTSARIAPDSINSRYFSAKKDDGDNDFAAVRVKKEEIPFDDVLSTTTADDDVKVSAKNEARNNNDKMKQNCSNATSDIQRTQSFEPMWHGTFHPESNIKIHTLFLGTHPSIVSLEKVQYFGFPTNAFWWMAGDCLGFRRASGISSSSGLPYKLTTHLVHGQDKVIPYDEQVQVMVSNGFAMWDLLGSCERKGSLDNDIKMEQPNPIREFCQEHPTIKRIIMANGSKQCTFFNKYFKDWWLSGELMPGRNDLSQNAFFKKWSKKTNGFENGRIEIICMPGVSPANALVPYDKKRDAYQEYCYNPGLDDHKRLNKC
ncbi:MAG: hypoxanthine-DNA glycosylase [Bacillariaceae sp.]|jgi:hypoxanthine-DNA glycosylase